MANFDTIKLIDSIKKEISTFSKEHQNETFYGFAIDANLLCLNSVEKFNETLRNYREKWGGYNTKEEIEDLKGNTGDWAYQGFAELSDNDGFDMNSYLEHYHADDEDQANSNYTKAIDNIIDNLKQSDIFNSLNVTADFYICRVEHNY
jgi:hypothetical protein